jgi:hypothetical protein
MKKSYHSSAEPIAEASITRPSMISAHQRAWQSRPSYLDPRLVSWSCRKRHQSPEVGQGSVVVVGILRDAPLSPQAPARDRGAWQDAAAAPASAPKRAAPIAAPIAEAAGERRHVTVMFCDLVDSTGIAARLDAEEWRDLVGAYLDAASTA